MPKNTKRRCWLKPTFSSTLHLQSERNKLRGKLAETYFFKHITSNKIVCAFSLSPEGLKAFDLPNSRRKKVNGEIPREKILKSYPAFLIGRLGVNREFNGQGIGTQLIIRIKYFCLAQYANFCRFLLVDAYNTPSVMNFYQKNSFLPVFSTEKQERNYYRPNSSEPLRVRYMYFDMKQWKSRIKGI